MPFATVPLHNATRSLRGHLARSSPHLRLLAAARQHSNRSLMRAAARYYLVVVENRLAVL